MSRLGRDSLRQPGSYTIEDKKDYYIPFSFFFFGGGGGNYFRLLLQELYQDRNLGELIAVM